MAQAVFGRRHQIDVEDEVQAGSAPRIPHPLPPELVDVLGARLRLYADPTRIRILDGLRAGERNVQAIADDLMTTQQNVSGHLRLLRASGVVSRRPAGREAYYAILDTTVYERVLASPQFRRD